MEKNFNLNALGLNIDVDVNKVRMPFYFKRKNECINCAGVNTLVFIDAFGRESRDEIRAFDHIKCKQCGKLYGIKWEKEENSDKMFPSAVDLDPLQDFKNMINSNVKQNGVKEF